MQQFHLLLIVIATAAGIFFLTKRESYQLPSKRLRTMGVGMRPEIAIRQLIEESTGLPSDIVDMIRFADFESIFFNILEQRIL